jgi:hypothetical protein
MKSMNAVALLFLITLILIAAPSLRATERMKSGQWEASITENGQAHTNTHCDTEDQVKGPIIMEAPKKYVPLWKRALPASDRVVLK